MGRSPPAVIPESRSVAFPSRKHRGASRRMRISPHRSNALSGSSTYRQHLPHVRVWIRALDWLPFLFGGCVRLGTPERWSRFENYRTFFADTKYEFRTDLPSHVKVRSIVEFDNAELHGQFEELIRILLRRLELPNVDFSEYEAGSIVRGRKATPSIPISEADVHEASQH
jgi:hypothetical protein